jgi:hypothetical protein
MKFPFLSVPVLEIGNGKIMMFISHKRDRNLERLCDLNLRNFLFFLSKIFLNAILRQPFLYSTKSKKLNLLNMITDKIQKSVFVLIFSR